MYFSPARRHRLSWLLIGLLTTTLNFAVDAQQVLVGDYQLSTNSPVHCDLIVENSRFDGDCCALNTTLGLGCVLNVVNGRCIIQGQYWTLNYTSTLTTMPCPPGEYDVLDDPTEDTVQPTPSPIDEDLIGRCGDCWCIPGNGGLETCPSGGYGITDSFDLEYQSLWSTFQLTNEEEAPFLTLDEGCYPFSDAIDLIESYPESEGPQCTKPDDGVCAYVFTEVETCAGRPYKIVTYESREAADEVGAVVTHEGGCGVCSSAQDLWVRIDTHGTLETDTIICATGYVFDQNIDTSFDNLVDCFLQLGFTRPCSTLWAHSAATSVRRCSVVCLPDPETGLTTLNGPPPACEPQSCLLCSEEWQDNFDALAGRTLLNSGITERIARPCDDFARIVHDPCTMLKAAPTPSPSKIEPGTGGPPAGTGGPPRNDRCVDSVNLLENVPVQGNTAMANFDYVNQGVCGQFSDRRAIWYEIVGSGGTVTVKVCSNNERAVAFGIFAQCNSQDCVGFAVDTAGGRSCTNSTAASNSFPSDIGQNYYVHVREADSGVVGANFTIVYTEAGAPGPTPAPIPPQGGGVVIENAPLSASSPQSCDIIIESSSFEGDCCAVNSTQGGGCILNIVNGRCIVRGEYWTLDYTSTFNEGGATCPSSEFNVLPANASVLVEAFPLTASSPESCDVIIESSSFGGDCCAVNSTQGGGCVLNVVNGRCIVRGEYWTLDYTSTFNEGGGTTCPPSEYDVLSTRNPTGYPTHTPSVLILPTDSDVESLSPSSVPTIPASSRPPTTTPSAEPTDPPTATPTSAPSDASGAYSLHGWQVFTILFFMLLQTFVFVVWQ